MLKNVLNTKNTVKSNRSTISGEVQLGMTIFINFLILLINMASTFPFPPFITCTVLSSSWTTLSRLFRLFQL